MKVSYHDKPFKIDSLPVKQIHVIDDWMDHENWVWLNKYITGLRRWGFNNSVVYKDGTVTETTWGMVFYSKFFEQPDPNDDYGKPIKQKVIDRLCNEFGIECIDAMASAFGKETVEDYARVNAFKYVWRANEKGKEKEDIRKAIWYLKYSIGEDPRA